MRDSDNSLIKSRVNFSWGRDRLLVCSQHFSAMDQRLLGLFLVLLFQGSFGGQFPSEVEDLVPAGGCGVSVKDDFSGFYPLLFDEEGKFWPYTKSLDEEHTWDSQLQNGKEMIVSCAPNYLRNFNNKKTVKFSCQNNKLTNDLGVEKKWKDVTCELRPVEEISAIVEHCETTSYAGVEFGYVNPVSKKTLVMGKACYSQEKGHTLFVHMRLKPTGKGFDESALEIEPETYFQRKQHPSGRYKIDLMKAWGDYARTRLENENLSITTKRFAFPQSVHLNTMKKLGWNYAFSQEDHETWPLLQEELNAMVEKKKDLVMEYYAGSHGVMKVNGQALYLKEQKFPVPEYLWMFVREDVQGVAFVVFNKLEMSVEEEKTFQEVCSSKCDEVQWLSNDFKTKNQKYLLCCDVNDARANIPEMPLVTGITHTFLY